MGERQTKDVNAGLDQCFQDFVGVRSRANCRYDSRAPHGIPFVLLLSLRDGTRVTKFTIAKIEHTLLPRGNRDDTVMLTRCRDNSFRAPRKVTYETSLPGGSFPRLHVMDPTYLAYYFVTTRHVGDCQIENGPRQQSAAKNENEGFRGRGNGNNTLPAREPVSPRQEP